MTASVHNVANKHFDFIVVGAGIAGLTLAAKLAEGCNKPVLVLEAGQANINDPEILRPPITAKLLADDHYCWMFQTTKQPFQNDKVHIWHRGKGLGGSSAVNFMVYMRPPAEDFNDFERLGNPGFNWNNLNGALQKVEGFVRPRDEALAKGNLKADKWSLGIKGPLKLSFPPTVTILESMAQEAMTNAGVGRASDPHGGNSDGFFISPPNYDPASHTRSYATTAFYLPNKDRPNFTVLTSACVHRVVTKRLSNGDISATGVEFLHDGQKHVVHANKEVIVSAGALLSPQLLELSGIGGKKVLDEIGIPVQIDLPGVGSNMQEHGMFGLSLELKDETVTEETFDALRDPVKVAKQTELHASGTGLHTQGVIGFALPSLDKISSRIAEVRKSIRDSIMSKWDTYSPGLQLQYKVQFERLERGDIKCEFATYPGLSGNSAGPNPPSPGKKHISFTSLLMQPFSRGTVHSISSDPNVPPEIDPHYFEQDADLQILVEAMRFMKNLRNVSPLKETTTRELNPGPNVSTDDEIREYIKEAYMTSWHTSSSCSMLPRDRDGVVDPTFKVYGTTNLRVVDLSVIPLQVAAHTQSTAYAVGSYASEVILRAYA